VACGEPIWASRVGVAPRIARVDGRQSVSDELDVHADRRDPLASFELVLPEGRIGGCCQGETFARRSSRCRLGSSPKAERPSTKTPT
jgi:hypothetical protein